MIGSPKFMIPLATPEGLEPPTLGSEDQCSIQLSYGAALITSQFTTPYKIRPEQLWFDVALRGPVISGSLLCMPGCRDASVDSHGENSTTAMVDRLRSCWRLIRPILE